MELLTVHDDCDNWVGYKPCKVQKDGLSDGCEACPFYHPITGNYLIIEAGGLGSIVRSTVLSREIRLTNPNAQIQWLTHEPGVELLKNVPSVDRALTLEDASLLLSQEFDQVINYESEPKFLALAQQLQAKKKSGFVMNRLGRLTSTDGSTTFLRLQVDDAFRKTENQKSMQQLLLESAGFQWRGQGYDLISNPYEDSRARICFSRLNVGDNAIGLNIGSSSRHDAKRWPVEKFNELVEATPERQFVVLSGPEDQEALTRFQEIATASNLVFTDGTQSMSLFISMVKRLESLITADTFGLHVGIAMGVRTISLHGPVPSQEIEHYGRGESINLNLACSPCFANKLKNCRNPDQLACMRDISVARVQSALKTSPVLA